jgi:ATP synthase F1 delta subunit
MSVTKIAEPYAEALLELTVSDSSNKLTSDMNVVSQFLATSSDLKNFLGNPLITRLAKKKVINAVLGEQISSQTLTFLMLLISSGLILIMFLRNLLSK